MTRRKIFVHPRAHYCIATDKTTLSAPRGKRWRAAGEEGWGGGRGGLLGVRIHRLEYPRVFPLGLSWRWIQIPFAHWTTYSGQFRAKPGIPPLPAAAASRALLHHLCLPRLSRTGQKSQLVCIAIQLIERGGGEGGLVRGREGKKEIRKRD